jgi:hypothetical protein
MWGAIKEDWPVFLLIGIFLALLVLCFVGMYQSANAPHYHLDKSEWRCTKQGVENTLMPVSTGKTVALVPTTHSVCIEYQKVIE